MSRIERVLLKYVSNPQKMWDGNQRQTDKFLNRKSRIINFFGWCDEQYVHFVLAAARKRLEQNAMTVFIPSFGSSGSHLLQHIITLAYDAIPLGEIYIPDTIINEVNAFSAEDQNVFIEAYHLVHCADPKKILSLLPIINTAHKPTLEPFHRWAKNKEACLILRNPVDLVLSRTFRKNEFRGYLGKDNDSDLEYLKENIRKTKTFYKAAQKFDYQHQVKFEEIVSTQEKDFLSTISELMSFMPEKTSLEAAREEAVRNGNDTNKYSGEKVTIDEEFERFCVKEFSDFNPNFKTWYAID